MSLRMTRRHLASAKAEALSRLALVTATFPALPEDLLAAICSFVDDPELVICGFLLLNKSFRRRVLENPWCVNVLFHFVRVPRRPISYGTRISFSPLKHKEVTIHFKTDLGQLFPNLWQMDVVGVMLRVPRMTRLGTTLRFLRLVRWPAGVILESTYGLIQRSPKVRAARFQLGARQALRQRQAVIEAIEPDYTKTLSRFFCQLERVEVVGNGVMKDIMLNVMYRAAMGLLPGQEGGRPEPEAEHSRKLLKSLAIRNKTDCFGLMSNFEGLDHLEKLELENHPLILPEMARFGCCQGSVLKELRLTNCDRSKSHNWDELLPGLPETNRIEVLHLHISGRDSVLTDVAFSSAPLSRLKSLNFKGKGLTGSGLMGLRCLVDLEIECETLEDAVFEVIGPHLRRLVMKHCKAIRFRGEGYHMTHLRELGLFEIAVNDESFRRMGCPGVDRLSLQGCSECYLAVVDSELDEEERDTDDGEGDGEEEVEASASGASKMFEEVLMRRSRSFSFGTFGHVPKYEPGSPGVLDEAADEGLVGTCFQMMKNMREVSLAYESTTDGHFFANMPNVDKLTLKRCPKIDERYMTRMTKLEELHVEVNNFQGSMFANNHCLTVLELTKVSGMQFDLIPADVPLRKLVVVEHFQMTEHSIAKFSNTLEELELEYCTEFGRGTYDPPFWRLSSLRIRNCANVTDAILTACNPAHLRHVELRYCPEVTGSGLRQYTKGITTLQIEHCAKKFNWSVLRRMKELRDVVGLGWDQSAEIQAVCAKCNLRNVTT